MCGVIGISSKNFVNQEIYDGLLTLQHRGQDAAGIATLDHKVFHIHKDNGLVRDVIRTRHMRKLVGNLGVGHVRYPTAGCASAEEAQPFYVNSPFGITLVHNGNLINTQQLKQEIFSSDRRHLNTSSDSEILTNVLAHELMMEKNTHLSADDIFQAFKRVYRRCSGAYAAIALIGDHGMVAFRDPYGIRPLIFGKKETAKGTDYIVASESVALNVLDYKIIRDVLPGEVIYFPKDSNEYYSQICAEKTEYRPCIFELIYLARPDSIIDGVSVHKSRLRMGEYLVDKILSKLKKEDIDVIIPIPDSGRTAALEIAEKLGIKFREGFIKNRYIGRTFIMPGQAIRQKSIKQKLNPIELELKDKNIMLVDDSIVRGNTSKKIVETAKLAGAKKVYFVSVAPPVKYPNVYGIDIPTKKELIAHSLNEEEIATYIGADMVFYQDIEPLFKAGFEGNPHLDGFEASVFDNYYCTKDITPEYLAEQELCRNDESKNLQNEKDNEDNLTLI